MNVSSTGDIDRATTLKQDRIHKIKHYNSNANKQEKHFMSQALTSYCVQESSECTYCHVGTGIE